jgi:hypothetical protein
MKKVFLGGTCNESQWREKLIIPFLDIEYFNPVVKDWNDEAYQEELKQREECDYVLYLLTPKMTGVYAIAETIDDSIKRPEKTVFCFITEDGEHYFDKGQIKSLQAVGKMVETNDGTWAQKIEDVLNFLNKEEEPSEIKEENIDIVEEDIDEINK